MEIKVIGLGAGSREYLSPAGLKAIEESEVIVGSRRAIAGFEVPERYELGKLAAAMEFIRKRERVSVIVSGDPGFYSLLDRLKEEFPQAKFEVIPSISSMQLAFARLNRSWQRATLLSLHGREPPREIIAAAEELGMLTDEKNTAGEVARLLMELGWRATDEMSICERLSYPQERVTTMTLSEATTSTAKSCVLIARRIRLE